VYVLALSFWFGGIITVGALIAPISAAGLHRFYVASSIAGGLVVTSLAGMAALGPRPSEFFARLSVAFAMVALTLYAGLVLRTLSVQLLTLTGIGGLALLFWEARDGTRAA
jgi:hypothetical protein